MNSNIPSVNMMQPTTSNYGLYGASYPLQNLKQNPLQTTSKSQVRPTVQKSIYSWNEAKAKKRKNSRVKPNSVFTHGKTWLGIPGSSLLRSVGVTPNTFWTPRWLPCHL